jgi:hypothetical protein
MGCGKYVGGGKGVIDFRDVYKALINNDITVTEALHSKYYVVNPKYNHLLSLLKQDLPVDKTGYALKICEEAFIQLGIYYTTDDVQYLSNFVRMSFVANDLFDSPMTPLENAIDYRLKPHYQTYLGKIKTGEQTVDELEIKEQLSERYEEVKNKWCCSNFQRDAVKVKHRIVDILRAATAQNIQISDFIKALTKLESEAFVEITKVIQKENPFSLLSLIEKTDISRAIYKNTLDKIVKYGLADVSSKGVKGTEVKVLDEEVFNIVLEQLTLNKKE